MSAETYLAFTRLAESKRLTAICESALTASQACFGTKWPGPNLARHEREPSAAFLRPGRRMFQSYLSDLRELGGWQASKLVWQMLFPSAAYLRHRYPRQGRRRHWTWVPWLYLRRAFGGVEKIFRREGE